MNNCFRSKRYLVWVILVTLAFALAGCGEGEKAAANTPAPETTSLMVKVVNDADKSPISGATVVIGDSTGAMISYSTTDGSGEITFTDPPANATVTAALSGDNGTGTLYSLKTLSDVNISEVTINLDKVAASLGAVSVNVTSSIAGVDYWEVYGGDEYVVGYADNPISGTVNVIQSNIQSDGKVSFVAVGYDADGNPVGYGTIRDQTFTDGMTVDIDINTDLSTIAFNMSNIPTTAISFEGEVDMGRKEAAFIDPFWENVLAPIPSIVTTSVIPDEYGDLFRYEAWVNMADSAYHFSKNSAILGNQTVDWGTFPAIPSNLAMTNAGTARPTLSWSESDSAADYVKLWIRYDNDASTSSYRYSIEAPTTKTSIVFPELPESLYQFRPAWIDSFEAGNIETDIASGYDDSLVKYGQYISGMITEYVMKLSWKY